MANSCQIYGLTELGRASGMELWEATGSSQLSSLVSRDEEDAARPEKAQPPPLVGKLSSPLLQLAQDPLAPTYKQGILARKMHHDADGKKSKCQGWRVIVQWGGQGTCLAHFCPKFDPLQPVWSSEVAWSNS